MKINMKEELLILLLCLLISTVASESNPEVTLAHDGVVRGVAMRSLDDREFHAFRGIPYAKPPIGNRRFKAPEPADPWEGVFDATEEGYPCAQVPLMGGEDYIGNEDCLFLNVYTPKLEKDDELLPVIFWIHGGAFYAGDGGTEENGPEFLMDQNVVLVTINYRLGAFGFLSSGNQVIPGNFGLKDQVMALKWVQSHIDNFGGDKEKVVIWGYSAGGSLVEAHLFSSMSKGLFSGAIYQSGHLNSECGVRSRPGAALQVLSSIVKCDQIKAEDKLECLRQVSASTLAGAINSFPSWGMKIPIAFNVAQEFPDSNDKSWKEEPFLTVDPNKMLSEGKIINDVPTITGMVKDEGTILGYFLKKNKDLYMQADKNFKDVAKLGGCLYDLTPKKFDKIRKFYFGDEKIGPEQLDSFIEFQGDAMINWGQVSSALRQAQASKSPVYFYLFTFEGRISEALALGLTPIEGVGHADDLAYIFRRKVPFPDGKPNQRERNTIKRMGSILESFARTGNPISEKNDLFNLEWEPLGSEFKYLEINEELQMQKGFPFPERMNFWQQLTKKKKPAKTEL